MEDNILFYSVANENYEKYVPWFIYFLSQSYPSSFAVVDLSCPINKTTQKSLDVISDKTNYKFSVNDNQFSKFKTNIPDVIKTLRWLTFHDIFNEYKYLWVGDIDMCICNENPSLLTQHINHMNDSKLPFSNYQRTCETPRMCGVNVVETERWFSLLKDNMTIIKNDLYNKLYSIKDHRGRNEQLLYRLINRNIDNFSEYCSIERYHKYISSIYHGYHIRLMEQQGIIGIDREHNAHIYKDKFNKYINTDVFKQLCEKYTKTGKTLKGILGK